MKLLSIIYVQEVETVHELVFENYSFKKINSWKVICL